MSIQEKKSVKGTPYGIIKFSDQKGEFELFLFAEILVANREKLKESESFVITLQKDISSSDMLKKRINVRKIISLEDIINKPYSKVTIEITNVNNIHELKEILSLSGNTEINLVVNENNKKARYSLKNNRRIDLKLLKMLKSKEYVTKISV